MREFTFDLLFEAGSDPVADLFVEHDDLRVRSLNAPAGPWFWRLARAAGPAGPLETLESFHATDQLLSVELDGGGDGVECYNECIERAARRRVFYTYATDPDAATVYGLVGRSFEPGVVVETLRQADRQTWRLLIRPGETVGGFHDDLVARLPGNVSFRMGAIRDATAWREQAEPGDVPEEQRRAVRAAVQAGYYESPRQATLDEIAATLGIPRSTLSYRLRKAEAQLARAFVTTDAED